MQCSLCLAQASFLQQQLCRKVVVNPWLQNHEVRERLSVEGSAGNHPVQPFLHRKLVQLGFEYFQCLTILTGFLFSLNSISCGFISFHCLFSWHWALLRSIWLHLLCPLPNTQHLHIVPRPPSLDNASSLSFPRVKDAAVPQSCLGPLLVDSLQACPYLTCTGEPGIGPSTPVVSEQF